MFPQLQLATVSNSPAPPVLRFFPEQVSMMPELDGLPKATTSQDQDLIKELQAKLAAQSKVIGEMKKTMILQERKHKNQMELEKETQTVLRSRIAKLEATVKIKDQELKQSRSETALSQELKWVKRSRASLGASLRKDKERNAKLQSENLELKRKFNTADFTVKSVTQLYSELSEKHIKLLADIQLKKDQMPTQDKPKSSEAAKGAYPNLYKLLCHYENEQKDGKLSGMEFQRVRILKQIMKDARGDMEKIEEIDESMEEDPMEMKEVERQEIELMP